MFKKIIKDKKGSALVFVMILIFNALIIMSSMVFISTIQNRSSAAMTLTIAAYQQADSGLESVLRKINHTYTDTSGVVSGKLDDLCDDFSSSTGKCITNNPEVTVYFFDKDENVLDDSNDDLSEVGYVKVVGEAENGSNKISRSLKTTLFVAP